MGEPVFAFAKEDQLSAWKRKKGW